MSATCGSCNGSGKKIHLCTMKPIDCYTCQGSGVDLRSQEHIAGGKELRRRREYHDLSLREFAKKAGLRVVELSDAEFGRRDPAPYIALLAAPPEGWEPERRTLVAGL